MARSHDSIQSAGHLQKLTRTDRRKMGLGGVDVQVGLIRTLDFRYAAGGEIRAVLPTASENRFGTGNTASQPANQSVLLHPGKALSGRAIALCPFFSEDQFGTQIIPGLDGRFIAYDACRFHPADSG
jgi:hypothetical protein